LAQYFFDTSAAVKYYHTEAGSGRVAEIFAEPDRECRISSLGVLEIQSALALKFRMGEISREAAGTQRARLMLDIAAGAIDVCRLTDEHLVSAEQLIGRHGFTRRLRTLDALQLAVALDLASQGLLDFFVVADRVLGEAAALEGLAVINPEEP